jgi:hypothetical protein
MTTGTRDAHLPAFDEHRRRETGYELQATLVARPWIVGALAGRRL